jgi:hypothetical protein
VEVVGGEVGAELEDGREVVLGGPHPGDLLRRPDVGRHEDGGEGGDVLGGDGGDGGDVGVDALVVGDVAEELVDAVAVGELGAGGEAEVGEEDVDGAAHGGGVELPGRGRRSVGDLLGVDGHRWALRLPWR